jgi:hypothetical protein
MNLHLVTSSKIQKAGWENDTLYVMFPDGKTVAYSGVSESEYQTFLESPSLGRALSKIDKKHPARSII